MEQKQAGTRVKRRIFLIDPGMQRDFVLRAMTVLLLFTGVIVASILFTLHRFRALPLEASSMDAVELATWTAGFVLLLSLAAVTMYFIYLTHKIAGPAYRLKRQLADLAVGNYSQPIGLRQGDYLRDIATWIDKVREDLIGKRDRVQAVVTRAEVLRDLIVRGEGGSAKAKELLDAVVQDLKANLETGARVDTVVIRKEE